MVYYKLLRQRRISLNLSVEDVSSQTRLAPEYIRAIEEHNLDMFSDDFSFVRYFVHAYCDAIGVNWLVIQEEVDRDIHTYARMKNHALTQAQKKIVSAMRPASSNSKKKSRKNQSIFSWLSYKISGSYRFSRIISLGAVALGFLIVANLVTDVIAQRQQYAFEKQQQEELEDKERETEALAKQYQAERKKKAVKIEDVEDEINLWKITNLEQAKQINFSVDLPVDSYVAIYIDDELVAGSEIKEYSDKFSDSITVTNSCTVQLAIGTFAENKIKVEDKDIRFIEYGWYYGTPAVITFDVEFNAFDETVDDEDAQDGEDVKDDMINDEN